ncbi:hypothetical protein FA95DRAFT_1642240 [Auriscalpium vulgare]|uniref:Uncharacterized protein n=1 Tax=Auriscalpium vulgare TaxID=40419 RepID=A0ACB8RBW8_9AGAM|nr:hypothetical protein FA95DRAFT_1642240 [Auriscalpium vulgare]
MPKFGCFSAKRLARRINVHVVTRARDNWLVTLTLNLALYLVKKPRYGGCFVFESGIRVNQRMRFTCAVSRAMSREELRCCSKGKRNAVKAPRHAPGLPLQLWDTGRAHGLHAFRLAHARRWQLFCVNSRPVASRTPFGAETSRTAIVRVVWLLLALSSVPTSLGTVADETRAPHMDSTARDRVQGEGLDAPALPHELVPEQPILHYRTLLTPAAHSTPALPLSGRGTPHVHGVVRARVDTPRTRRDEHTEWAAPDVPVSRMARQPARSQLIRPGVTVVRSNPWVRLRAASSLLARTPPPAVCRRRAFDDALNALFCIGPGIQRPTCGATVQRVLTELRHALALHAQEDKLHSRISPPCSHSPSHDLLPTLWLGILHHNATKRPTSHRRLWKYALAVYLWPMLTSESGDALDERCALCRDRCYWTLIARTTAETISAPRRLQDKTSRLRRNIDARPVMYLCYVVTKPQDEQSLTVVTEASNTEADVAMREASDALGSGKCIGRGRMQLALANASGAGKCIGRGQMHWARANALGAGKCIGRGQMHLHEGEGSCEITAYVGRSA